MIIMAILAALAVGAQKDIILHTVEPWPSETTKIVTASCPGSGVYSIKWTKRFGAYDPIVILQVDGKPASAAANRELTRHLAGMRVKHFDIRRCINDRSGDRGFSVDFFYTAPNTNDVRTARLRAIRRPAEHERSFALDWSDEATR